MYSSTDKMKRFTRAIVFLVFMLIIAVAIPSVHGDVIENFPSAFNQTVPAARCTSTSGGDQGDFTNAQNAFSDNGITANAVHPGDRRRMCTEWTGFGFNFGVDSTINQVVVTGEFHLSTKAASTALKARLYTTDGATVCPDQEDWTESLTPKLFTSSSTGGATDAGFDFTACKSWTINDFNNDRIGVVLVAYAKDAPVTFFLDYTKIVVTFTLPTGELDAAIAGIPTELDWGKQYTQNPFTIIITLNTFAIDNAGVVPLVVVDKSCSLLSFQGFVLSESVDAGLTYTAITTITVVSEGCQFTPNAAVFGQTVTAGSISNVWYLGFTFGGEDVAGQSYSFRAQFARGV